MNSTLSMEDNILDAATRLFLKKGFKATSTTEIAREAGCNQALVHYYFRTKERLFEAIFRNKIKFFARALLDSGDRELPFLDRVRSRVESHFEAIRTDPELPLFFLSELSSNPERMEAVEKEVGDLPERARAQLETELNEEIDKGLIRPTSARSLLMTIASLNVMAFLGAPMIRIMTGISEKAYADFLEDRKQENVRIVLKSLEP